MNINLHTALRGKVAGLGGAAWNRLNLMRDAGSVRSYDFGPEDLREVRELLLASEYESAGALLIMS